MADNTDDDYVPADATDDVEVPVDEIDVEATEKALRDATEDVADAENDNDRSAAQARVDIATAKLEAAKAGAS
jgi:F0F1-type ATP synthase epsilon subunit